MAFNTISSLEPSIPYTPTEYMVIIEDYKETCILYEPLKNVPARIIQYLLRMKDDGLIPNTEREAFWTWYTGGARDKMSQFTNGCFQRKVVYMFHLDFYAYMLGDVR
jgi:hypothetical protein